MLILRDTEEFMHSTRLQQRLAISATFTLTVLIACLLGVGNAFRQGAAELPELDVPFYGIHIRAYRTDYPECPPTTLCPPQSLVAPARYYVIWSITELVSAHHLYGSTARRLLVVRLQR